MLWNWVLELVGGHRDQGSCWCCYLLEENLSSVVEWRAFKALQPWRQHTVRSVSNVYACIQSWFNHPHVLVHAALVPVQRRVSLWLQAWLLTTLTTMLYTPEAGRWIQANAGRHWNTCSRATQAAPTCYRDMYIDHRTVLDCSDSFLHPSCPYWFGPSPPRCAPVVLISNTLSFIPAKERKHVRREERRKRSRVEGRRRGRQRKRDKKKDIDCDKRDIRHHHHHQHWTGKSTGGSWPVPTF